MKQRQAFVDVCELIEKRVDNTEKSLTAIFRYKPVNYCIVSLEYIVERI